MQIGVCEWSAPPELAAAAGFDFYEENVQGYLKCLERDWAPAARSLAMPSGNSLIPSEMPIVGTNTNPARLRAYMAIVFERARQVGMRTLVFGCGAARRVPDGFDRTRAIDQILDFLAAVAPDAQRQGVRLVIEPLNRGECNIINTVTEAMTYVDRLNHPAIGCLVDTYHMEIEREPLSAVEHALPSVGHVHVADPGRLPPGESSTVDYLPLFRLLKGSGYKDLIAIESHRLTLASATPALAFLRETWDLA